MHDGARRALRTESELNQALRRGELVLHYQPLVRLADRAIRGVEALVRWHHPERGLVGPDEFIGTAEDTGLIRRLGAWVLDEACAQLAAWRAAGLAADLPVSVNLSPRQLDDEALVMRVADVLAEHALDPAALVLEVTETVLLADDRAALARLQALKALGVGIALDARVALDGSLMSLTNTRPGDEAAGRGGGTGWSSLSSLGSLPVDALKLDRSFVRQMGEQPQARRIVTAVLGLARSMGLGVVAEGVEDEERAETLAALGCEIGQGHMFSPAVPAIAMETLLARDVPRPAERIRVYLCDDAPEAEDVEVARRDAETRDLLGLGRPSEVVAPAGGVEQRQRLERTARARPVAVVRHRGDAQIPRLVEVPLPHGHEALDVGERQRPQQRRVDHAEHGGVGADAERERQDGNGREPGRAAPRAGRVAEVVEQRAHHGVGRAIRVPASPFPGRRFPGWIMRRVFARGIPASARGWIGSGFFGISRRHHHGLPANVMD
jgi:EAL domain-containing protein (putative c-di-GMP-specific phosphodiesterase class I)